MRGGIIMQQVNIHAAKTHLSALVEKAAAGEPFIIAKSGRPLVKVVPFEEEAPLPRVGFYKTGCPVPEDFDTMLQDEIIAMFEGKYEGKIKYEGEYENPA
jgi:prevent-host-death family protein